MSAPVAPSRYTVVCFWCARVLTARGWVVLDAPPAGPVSHGICEACVKVYFPGPVDPPA